MAFLDYHYSSQALGKQTAAYVLLPETGEGPFPVLYLLHGLSDNHTIWLRRTSIERYVANLGVIVVMPDGGRGFYTDAAEGYAYGKAIGEELVARIDKTFPTQASREGRVIAGLSMGGYGSLKFGLKYPEMFSLIGGFSGALGAAGWTEKNAGTIAKSMDSVFSPDEASEARTANDIFRMVREITPEKVRALPYIFLSCGTEDSLIKNNQDFVTLLNDKKVPHEYREHPGVHDWAFWDDQVREFLDLAERRLKK